MPKSAIITRRCVPWINYPSVFKNFNSSRVYIHGKLLPPSARILVEDFLHDLFFSGLRCRDLRSRPCSRYARWRTMLFSKTSTPRFPFVHVSQHLEKGDSSETLKWKQFTAIFPVTWNIEETLRCFPCRCSLTFQDAIFLSLFIVTIYRLSRLSLEIRGKFQKLYILRTGFRFVRYLVLFT